MNTPELYINNSVVIRSGKVILDGQTIFRSGHTTDSEFLRALYGDLTFSYPKFFKMDPLCKLGFLASEILLKKNTPATKDNTGILLMNSTSSLYSDLEHTNSIRNPEAFFPGPAVFVYTLPNIVLGEICIRNGFGGENAFYIFEEFQPDFLENILLESFRMKRMDFCICGKVDFFANCKEAVLFMVSEHHQKGSVSLSTENLQKLYESNEL